MQPRTRNSILFGRATHKVESELRFQVLAKLLTSDPSQRGIAGLRPWGAKSACAALQASAQRLCECRGAVGIVTGFCIPSVAPPTAETDGPPGALALARALEARGVAVHLISDPFAAPMLELGRDHCGLRAALHIVPWRMVDFADDLVAAQQWIDSYLNGPGAQLDALVAIERVGPSHIMQSAVVGAQHEADTATLFESEVYSEHRDRRHNMRGEIIDRYTPPLDTLFEKIKVMRPECFTLGIGDGGNEIGLGCFSWRQLREAIRRGPAANIACRIATDEVITAGISNWGAYALVAAMALVDRSLDLASILNTENERQLLIRLVKEAGAVDGVTLQREASVDGVAADEYLALMERIIAAAQLE